MVKQHILSLEVPTVANCNIISIRDTSQYSNLLDVDCAELLVTVPGFNQSALIKVEKDFFLNITSCDLGVQKEQCDSVTVALPDGVYIIRYSVAPNDQTFVEYNHLRVTQILTLYYKTLNDIGLKECEPSSIQKELIEELQYIRTLIDGAVAQVEYCGDVEKGMSMYNYALKKLNKLVCRTTGC